MHYQTYAVIGAGAVGGLYGARLQQAGANVHFLLRSDYDHVQRHGLRVESVDGDINLPQVNVYRHPGAMPKCDVVLVALKTTQNHLLPEILPPVVKTGTLVVMLQNGLGVEDEAAAVVGPDFVFGGLCFVCSNRVGPGHICHLDYGHITLAQYTANHTPVGLTQPLRCLAKDFEQAGVQIIVAEDLLTARWQKLVWNVPFNGLSVVLDAQTDALMGNAYTRRLVEVLMNEVVLGAQETHRRHIPPGFVQKMLAATEKMKPYKTSMKLDFDSGRPMEIEAIFGTPLRLAQQAGANVPYLDMLYQQLKFLNSRS
jgi:2-dehydropantoate 2-reductase